MKLPVLLIFFNRKDYVLQVLEAIRKYRPEKLYLASDGPRSLPGEDRIVTEVREAVTGMIDWECEVKTLFQERNLSWNIGGVNVVTAINWFFENEEAGLIFEDDCVPADSFFMFAEDMIERFRSNDRIWGIGSAGPTDSESPYSYSFSAEIRSWGWATWRDRWQKAQSEVQQIRSWDLEFLLEDYLAHRFFHFMKNIRSMRQGRTCWDWALQMVVLRHHGFWVCPECNLMTNVGIIGTHCMDGHAMEIPRTELTEIIHPPELPDYAASVSSHSYYPQGGFRLLSDAEYAAQYRQTIWEIIKLYPRYKLAFGSGRKEKKAQLRKLRGRLHEIPAMRQYLRLKNSADPHAELQKLASEE